MISAAGAEARRRNAVASDWTTTAFVIIQSTGALRSNCRSIHTMVGVAFTGALFLRLTSRSTGKSVLASSAHYEGSSETRPRSAADANPRAERIVQGRG
jgi:hypothetical protein